MENYNQNNPEQQKHHDQPNTLDEILTELKTSGITIVENLNEVEYSDNFKIYFRFTAQLASILEQNKKLADAIKNDTKLPTQLKDNFSIDVAGAEKGFDVAFYIDKNATNLEELKAKAKEILEKIIKSLSQE